MTQLRNAILLALVVPTIASAQLAVDRSEILMRSGVPDDRVTVINVRNDGAQQVQATVSLEDWDRDSVGTNRWFKTGSVAGSCGERLTIFPRALQLAPGQEGSIRVVLDPNSTVAAECWAAAVLQVARPGTSNGRSAMINIRTAVKLYVTPPTALKGGEVSDLLIDRDSIELHYTNTGARHGVASGRIEFRNTEDHTVATVLVPDLYVLPGAARLVRLTLPKLPSGRYIVLAVMDFGGAELAAGQTEYEVRAEFLVGAQKP